MSRTHTAVRCKRNITHVRRHMCRVVYHLMCVRYRRFLPFKTKTVSRSYFEAHGAKCEAIPTALAVAAPETPHTRSPPGAGPRQHSTCGVRFASRAQTHTVRTQTYLSAAEQHGLHPQQQWQQLWCSILQPSPSFADHRLSSVCFLCPMCNASTAPALSTPATSAHHSSYPQLNSHLPTPSKPCCPSTLFFKSSRPLANLTTSPVLSNRSIRTDYIIDIGIVNVKPVTCISIFSGTASPSHMWRQQLWSGSSASTGMLRTLSAPAFGTWECTFIKYRRVHALTRCAAPLSPVWRVERGTHRWCVAHCQHAAVPSGTQVSALCG
jgi:hypothetical protein